MTRDKGKRKYPEGYKRIVVCAACCLMLAAGFPSMAAKEGKVVVNSANVRSEASQDSQSQGHMTAGMTFTVTEEATDASNHVWYHVTYTSEGAEKTGWIRSDMAEITSEGEPEEPEIPENPEGEIATGTDISIQGITLREPDSLPEAQEGLSASQVTIGGNIYTALAVDGGLTGGAEFYLVYAEDASGFADWYFYDAGQGTLQRNVGQFTSGGSGSDGLLQALQEENEKLKENKEDGISIRNFIILGVGALCLILLIVVIVLAVKMSRIEFIDDDEYDDDDGEDYEDEEKDDYDEDEEESDLSWMQAAWEEKKAADKKKKGLKVLQRKEEPEEEDDWEEDDLLEEYPEDKEEEISGDYPDDEDDFSGDYLDDEDGFSDDYLDEEDDFSDVSLDELERELAEGYLEDDEDDFQEPWEEEPRRRPRREKKEKEKKEKKKKPAKASRVEVSEDDFDDSEDFDVEIVDLDDLDL